MSTAADLLFDEFAAAWARGDHPDVRDYLDRAGDERDELTTLLDGFIAAASVLPPSEETLATFAELVPGDHETPPMLAVRVRMGLRRSDVVRQLCRGFGLDPAAEPKVARYYHELETGLLDPRGVNSHVWHHLATILGGRIRALMVSPYEAPPAVIAAYYRLSDSTTNVDQVPAPAPTPPAIAQPDEVDMLFTGNA